MTGEQIAARLEALDDTTSEAEREVVWRLAVEWLVERGLAVKDGKHFVLTPEGMDLAT